MIILFGLLLYSSTAFFDFSYLDDHVLILDNYPIISDISNVGRMFTDDAFFSSSNFYYRPILNISFMFDSFISGSLPWFFHLVNVLLHILVSCLVFALLNKLKAPRFLSFFLTLLFLFHPALVQVVAWIPGRNDSLLTIFIISSFLFFLQFLEKFRLTSYILYLVFFALALFVKEAAIVFPFLLIFYYIFLVVKKISRSDILILTLGTLATVFIWFIFRSLAMTENNLSINNIIISILDNSPAVIIGLGRFFFPLDLSVMSVIRDNHIMYGLLAVIVLAILTICKKGVDKRYFVFGLLWFLLFFIPSLINPNSTAVFYFLEHRLYLSFVGLLIIISQIKFLNNLNYKKAIVYLPFALVLGFAIFLSAKHLPDFKNRISFWQSAVISSPSSPMAHRNLGAMYYLDGRSDEALIQYQLALDANKNEPMAHNNIGLIYMNQGRLLEAEAEFKKELEINPSYDKALANLEGLLILKNRLR